MSKKIKAMTVEYEDGTKERFTGEAGFVHRHTVSKKGQPYRVQVTAAVTLPPVEISPNV
jgi:hypothetical protein